MRPWSGNLAFGSVPAAVAHAPERLHEEVTADYNDMIYAATPEEIEKRRKTFIRKWQLKHRAVANCAPPRTQSLCCSGRCSLPARLICARSMDGRALPSSPSISQLTSQLDPIPSVVRRLRRSKFQPRHGRHPLIQTALATSRRKIRRRRHLARSIRQAENCKAERNCICLRSPPLIHSYK
jgi:hypothetical protein